MPIRKIRRSKRARKRRQRRRPINVIASVLTTFSLYCGIASIFASINEEYDRAAYWILAAIFLDTMDGAVARVTKSVSKFGKELDSLSDIVSFGVAPAVLIYSDYLLEEKHTGSIIGPTGSMMAIIFVICGALRLARYNVYQSEQRQSFAGLPIPAAAGTIASFVLFTSYFEWQVAFWMLGPLAIALASLMVSTIRYPREIHVLVLAPRHAFRLLILVVVAIAVFHYASRQFDAAIVLLPLGMAYVLSGIVNYLYNRIRKRGRIEDKPKESDPVPPSMQPPEARLPE